jgi:galactokinase
MDQFAVACGRADAALLLDCRSLEWRPVALPLERLTLVVCDSGQARSLAGSEYNVRRAQCDAAVAALATHEPAIHSLRDVSVELIGEAAARGWLDAVVLRRATHVVHENERVLEAIQALEAGDLPAIGRLFAASHASLRDLFEVSSPELDAMVEIASAVPGVLAARMTGAGFGGCAVALVEDAKAAALVATVGAGFEKKVGVKPALYVTRPSAGASHEVL